MLTNLLCIFSSFVFYSSCRLRVIRSDQVICSNAINIVHNEHHHHRCHFMHGKRWILLAINSTETSARMITCIILKFHKNWFIVRWCESQHSNSMPFCIQFVEANQNKSKTSSLGISDWIATPRIHLQSDSLHANEILTMKIPKNLFVCNKEIFRRERSLEYRIHCDGDGDGHAGSPVFVVVHANLGALHFIAGCYYRSGRRRLTFLFPLHTFLRLKLVKIYGEPPLSIRTCVAACVCSLVG